MDLDTDRQLLERWRGGDRQAAAPLIDHYYPLVRRTIQTKVPEATIDDLTQRVFTALVERHQAIRAGASVRAYILGITHRTIADFYRYRQRRPIAAAELDLHSVADLGAGPVTLLLARQETRLLLEALRAIRLDYQFILELHYWENLSGPELAQALEIPEGTIRSRIRRAKAALREALQTIAQGARELAETLTDLDAWALKLRDELRALYPRLPERPS